MIQISGIWIFKSFLESSHLGFLSKFSSGNLFFLGEDVPLREKGRHFADGRTIRSVIRNISV